jgi:hypothetical protein
MSLFGHSLVRELMMMNNIYFFLLVYHHNYDISVIYIKSNANLDSAFNPYLLRHPNSQTTSLPLFYKSELGQPQKFTPLLGKSHRVYISISGDIG